MLQATTTPDTDSPRPDQEPLPAPLPVTEAPPAQTSDTPALPTIEEGGPRDPATQPTTPMRRPPSVFWGEFSPRGTRGTIYVPTDEVVAVGDWFRLGGGRRASYDNTHPGLGEARLARG